MERGKDHLTRQSGFELLRILAMLMVLGVHSNFLALKQPTEALTLAAPAAAFYRNFLEMLCLAAVDIFVMISGWFGIRPRLRGVLNLVFLLIFWRVVCLCVFPPEGYTAVQTLLFLTPGYSDWFIQTYLLLMLVAPALNSFLEATPRAALRRYLIIFFSIEFSAGWLLGHIYTSPIDRGYSLIAFIGLYCLAHYVRRYVREDAMTVGRGVALFAGIAAASAVALTLCIRFGVLPDTVRQMAVSYVGPHTVGMALVAIMTARRLKFTSQTVNSLAGSALVIYAVHCNPIAINHFIFWSRKLYAATGLWWYFAAFAGCAVIFYLLCWLGDRLRLLLWQCLLMWRRSLAGAAPR